MYIWVFFFIFFFIFTHIIFDFSHIHMNDTRTHQRANASEPRCIARLRNIAVELYPPQIHSYKVSFAPFGGYVCGWVRVFQKYNEIKMGKSLFSEISKLDFFPSTQFLEIFTQHYIIRGLHNTFEFWSYDTHYNVTYDVINGFQQKINKSLCLPILFKSL